MSLRWNIKEDSPVYHALLEPQNSLFVPRDMEIIIPYLAHNFPVVPRHISQPVQRH